VTGGETSKAKHLKKRSFAIAGHRTSIALEAEFWAALAEEAETRKLALVALVAAVDAGRAGGNLASALRVHVLKHALEKTKAGK
jgi:predicted DNA-binding ribbon-helix-helix protein